MLKIVIISSPFTITIIIIFYPGDLHRSPRQEAHTTRQAELGGFGGKVVDVVFSFLIQSCCESLHYWFGRHHPHQDHPHYHDQQHYHVDDNRHHDHHCDDDDDHDDQRAAREDGDQHERGSRVHREQEHQPQPLLSWKGGVNNHKKNFSVVRQ